MKVFLDANVFFAAAGSLTGGSAFVLELAKKKKFSIVTVTHALLESEKNIQNKLGDEALLRHYQNVSEAKPEIQPIEATPLKIIAELEKFVPLKDVPILLGAILSNCYCLLTLDKKDFLDNEKLKALKLSFEILAPGDFLRKYLREMKR